MIATTAAGTPDWTRLVRSDFGVAPAMPVVRMNKSIRSFCSAKTCSTHEPIFDLALLARQLARTLRVPSVLGMDMTDKAVLLDEDPVCGRPNRRYRQAAASVALHLGIKPKRRSIAA